MQHCWQLEGSSFNTAWPGDASILPLASLLICGTLGLVTHPAVAVGGLCTWLLLSRLLLSYSHRAGGVSPQLLKFALI